MTTIDFSSRSTLPELMDGECVGFEEFRACLVDLARVNRVTLAYRPTLRFMDRLAERGLPVGRPLEVLDVGSGYGDMLRRIDAWAERRGIDVALTGVDLNPWSRVAASAATRPGRPIRWVTADAFTYAPPAGVDVIVSSLFTHHLSDPLVARFMRWMDVTARLGWFINDLHRHPVPYHFFRRFARVANYHHFVQHDGPVSIARAFDGADWRRLLGEAGIDLADATVAWWLPFRLCVERLKGAAMIDAVIIGGGLAGAAAATRLAAAGREVVVLEREQGPHDKVCGEFLSGEAARYLGALGLDLPALGAVPIVAVRLAHRATLAEVPLPFPAYSLSRRVLDEALLARAAAAGATIRRGARVAALTRSGAGYHARLVDGEVIAARSAFLATGKHDLRGWRRPAGLQNDLLAFKLYYRLAADQATALDRRVELALFDGGYCGLSPVEGGRANLCLLVRRHRFAALGQRWDDLLAAIRAASPHLEARLHGAEACRDRPLALSAIPYGHVQRRADGPFRLGDQAAVIPSFAGDGMSIALHSAELAAAAYLADRGAEAFQRRLARDVTGQVLLATGLSHGLVRRPTQTALSALVRRFPGVMATVAAYTRVPDAALARTRMELP